MFSRMRRQTKCPELSKLLTFMKNPLQVEGFMKNPVGESIAILTMRR